MALLKKIISVEDFEKSINPDELIKTLNSFGLLEPLARVYTDTVYKTFNTTFVTRELELNLSSSDNSYRINLDNTLNKKEASVVELH